MRSRKLQFFVFDVGRLVAVGNVGKCGENRIEKKKCEIKFNYVCVAYKLFSRKLCRNFICQHLFLFNSMASCLRLIYFVLHVV